MIQQKLKDLVSISKGKKMKELDRSDLRYIQIEDLRGDTNLKFCEDKKSSVKCKKDDILIAWDGANAGTIGYGIEGAIGSTIARLVIKDSNVYPPYLGKFLQSKFKYLRENCTGATIPHISKSVLIGLEIPLPPLETQKRIAEILDNAAALRDKTKQLLEEYDQLAQSIFLEMFGDPVGNNKAFKIDSLLNYGSFKNGLNFSSNEIGYKIKTLGVGDFKARYRIDDAHQLSNIHLTKMPSEDYFLKNDDLVFVRSNGNKNLVGRCLIMYPNNEKVTFSGFCIRYRLEKDNLNALFLAFLFRNKGFKQSILKGGRGANIQNINQKILGALKIIIPPIELQNQFVEKIALIEQQKELAKQELKESEVFFQALLQKAFKGELVKEENYENA